MNPHQQYIFDFPKREILTKEGFIVADCNRAAYEIIAKYPHWPVRFLAIFGAPKSGKSHLAGIWAAQFRARKILPNDLPDIMSEIMPETISGASFETKKLSADIFWLKIPDGSDFFSGEIVAQEALFHLYNQIIQNQQGALLITATTPPSLWNLALKDLQSRMSGLPAVKLGQPDDALLEKLLKKLCADRQLIMKDDVLKFVIRRMERSFEFAYLLADRLDQQTLEKQKPITIALARGCL